MNYSLNYLQGKEWSCSGNFFKIVNSSESDLNWESYGESAVVGVKKKL